MNLNPIRAKFDDDTLLAEKETKPWKFERAYMLTAFRWVLLRIDVRFPFFSSIRRSLLTSILIPFTRQEAILKRNECRHNKSKPNGL